MYEQSMAELILTQRDEAQRTVDGLLRTLQDKQWTLDKLREHCLEIAAELVKRFAAVTSDKEMAGVIIHLNKLGKGELP